MCNIYRVTPTETFTVYLLVNECDSSKVATALARFIHRNFVCPSVRHTRGSVKNGTS